GGARYGGDWHGLRPEREERALVLEQVALHVQAAAEPRQRAVGADHAVTGQDDRERVAAVRRADRPRRVAAEAEPARLLAVAHRLPVGDRPERQPAAALDV